MQARTTARVGVAAAVCAALVALGAPAPVTAAPAAPVVGSGSDGPGFVDGVDGPRGAPAGGTWVPWSPAPGAPVADAGVPEPEVGAPEGGTAGLLDLSFSGDGRHSPNFVSGPEDAASVAVQPDGKIVVGGGAGAFNSRLQVARFHPDGRRDKSFGGGDGVVRTNISPGPDWIEDIALQPNGKIVAVGSAWGFSVLVRYNANGTLDTGFANGGVQLLAVGRGFNVATAVVVDGAGRIAFAGRGGGGGGRFVVARVGANGNPDTSFSGDGIAIADFTAGDDFAWDLALQADGKLVAAGVAGGTPAAMAVLRLTTNGSNDPTFDGDGRASAGLSGEDAATSVAIQPDGAVVVGGFNSLNGGQMLIGRMLPSGAMDPAFSGDGLVPVNFGGTADYAWRVAVQADGAIVAVGRAGGAGGRFAVARVTSAGILDGSFSGDGKVGTNFTAGNDEAHSVAIDGAGNLVVSGVANGGTSAARIAIARYLAT